MNEQTPAEQVLHKASAVAQDLVKTNEAKAAELVAYAATSAAELKKVLDEHKEESQSSLVFALREVLNSGDEDSGTVLIKRIPFICNDIRDIKNDMRWIKYLGSGFLLAAGGLALKALGIVSVGHP